MSHRLAWFLGSAALVGLFCSAMPLVARPTAAQAVLGSLHDRAARLGGQLSEVLTSAGDVFVANLRELNAHADAVVVCRALSITGRLDPSGSEVQSDVALKVLVVSRGVVDSTNPIVVRVPGGQYRFEDGVSVSQSIRGYAPMRQARMYALFLRRQTTAAEPTSATFVLAAGVSSQFEFNSRAVTISPASTRARDSINERYRDMDLDAFLRELSASVRSR
jgi:hypothetical protein